MKLAASRIMAIVDVDHMIGAEERFHLAMARQRRGVKT